MGSPSLPLLLVLMCGIPSAFSVITKTGEFCGPHDTCDEGGMCLLRCCSPEMPTHLAKWVPEGTNCHSCGSNGLCLTDDIEYQSWSIRKGPGISVGEACGSDDTCAGNATCLTHCCSLLMKDENCHSCNSKGWCASCYDGCQWTKETGCAAPNPETGNCLENEEQEFQFFDDVDLD